MGTSEQQALARLGDAGQPLAVLRMTRCLWLVAVQALQGEGEGVSVSNLCLLMDSAGLTLSEEDVVRMLEDVGAKRNEDGSIPYASFVKLLIA